MEKRFTRLFLIISSYSFSCSLMSQGRPDVLKDSIQMSLKKKDTIEKTTTFVSDDTDITQSHFQIGVSFQSNDVYLGRTDSTVIPLVTPQISYIFRSGFQIDLNLGINVHGPQPKLNSYSLDVSYTFDWGNYTGVATISASNYSLNSGSPKAAQKGSLEYDNSYDFGFMQSGLNLSWIFADHPDYQVIFSLQHEFNFFEDALNITPMATMSASTQNVYNAYYNNRRFIIHRPGKPPPADSITVSGQVLNSGKFQIMDYEFSIPVNFSTGNWTFNFTPTYALPVNPADILLTTTTNSVNRYRTYKETLPNQFYYQIGVVYDF